MTTDIDATLFPMSGSSEPANKRERSSIDTPNVKGPQHGQHFHGQLRRSTLITLRWTAVAGQLFALIVVGQVLGFTFPYWPCIMAIGLSATINVIMTLALPLDRQVGHLEAVAQLGFDLLQLYALLWFTGGMTNPFVLLFVAPVVFSATTLSRPVLLILALLASALSFSLLYYSHPLPWSPQGGFSPPFIFRLGMWVSLVVGIAFTSLYAWRAAQESRRMSEALASTEAALAHEKTLTALGGMAAAAAHELGTPLATIQITAKEMTRELAEDTPLGEDARLVLSQTQRCRDILKQLASRGDEGDAIHDELTFYSLLEEVSQPFMGADMDFHLKAEGNGPAPRIERRAELIYGLKNLVENAADFAATRVDVFGSWDGDKITVDISDDGPGFDPSIRPKLGEPYISRRDTTQNAGGLGLGIFIAKTLIERTNGKVRFGRSDYGGARVTLSWPRTAASSPDIIQAE